RAVAPSTYILAPRSETPPSGTPPLLPIPLHASSLPLLLPSTIHRADVREVALPPRKRLCITLGLRFEVGESSSAPTARPAGVRADYGFVGTLDDKIRRDPEREVGYRIIDTWDEMVEDIQGAPVAINVARLSNHDSGTGVRRQAPLAYECTYQDFMKSKTLYFKGTDVVSYNQRLQELALMCARMFSEESDKIERYTDGLPDMIRRSVMESKPKTTYDAIEFTTELMDKKISTFVER
nr:hypothetical protein [Tanacetum cinerariifolium]